MAAHRGAPLRQVDTAQTPGLIRPAFSANILDARWRSNPSFLASSQGHAPEHAHRTKPAADFLGLHRTYVGGPNAENGISS
jgi:hypothetical protein